MVKHLTLAEAAAQRGIDPSALRHAIRRGRLNATRSEDGRDWLVTSTEMRRYDRITGPPPEGFITAAEAARRMRRSRQRVHQMIRSGVIPARRTKDGRVFVPADAVGEVIGDGTSGGPEGP